MGSASAPVGSILSRLDLQQYGTSVVEGSCLRLCRGRQVSLGASMDVLWRSSVWKLVYGDGDVRWPALLDDVGEGEKVLGGGGG